jgi:uncharacterized membrane protein
MKRMFKLLRTTLVGGVLFLAPIVVVLAILEKALHLAHKLVAPLAVRIPVESVIGLRTPMLLACAMIVLFCFLAGLLARTGFAQGIVNWLESKVLFNLPGYEFFKGISESMLGVDKPVSQQVVFAHLEDAWQIGFLIERLDNGLLAVFIPDAPNPHSGAVCFLVPDQVTPADVPSHAMLKCLKRLGAGSNALVGTLVVEGAIPKPVSSMKQGLRQ